MRISEPKGCVKLIPWQKFLMVRQKLTASSRIWAGVHTRTADNQGYVLGKQVGDYVFQNALPPLKS
ncbi:hypothetical protein PN499_03715 [Kamptonema animale CS-326]|uniref:hypothetical protein n=1 Tax=Kamptonema animale TaxID=92934 RepID=UPI00232D53A4|nr:hypothetical protein [Kamptonema animale]MDB9510309.1 hypothetical protein [Kamptonema animale CS-326]